MKAVPTSDQTLSSVLGKLPTMRLRLLRRPSLSLPLSPLCISTTTQCRAACAARPQPPHSAAQGPHYEHQLSRHFPRPLLERARARWRRNGETAKWLQRNETPRVHKENAIAQPRSGNLVVSFELKATERLPVQARTTLQHYNPEVSQPKPPIPQHPSTSRK